MYRENKRKSDQANIEENYEMIHATDYLTNHKIKCFKYNYSLDEDVQNFCQFEALMYLSHGGEYLNIINRKPNEN